MQLQWTQTGERIDALEQSTRTSKYCTISRSSKLEKDFLSRSRHRQNRGLENNSRKRYAPMSTRFFAIQPIVAAFSTRTDTAPSQWALWVLCGVAAVLLIGIFLLARSPVQAKKQAASLQEKLSAAEMRFQAHSSMTQRWESASWDWVVDWWTPTQPSSVFLDDLAKK